SFGPRVPSNLDPQGRYHGCQAARNSRLPAVQGSAGPFARAPGADLQGRPACLSDQGRNSGDAGRRSPQARGRRRTVTDFAGVIPARVASARLPGGPLLDLGGLPMVVQVARRAGASGAHRAIVATGHAGIAETVARDGFEAAMTAADHPSGT